MEMYIIVTGNGTERIKMNDDDIVDVDTSNRVVYIENDDGETIIPFENIKKIRKIKE